MNDYWEYNKNLCQELRDILGPDFHVLNLMINYENPCIEIRKTTEFSKSIRIFTKPTVQRKDPQTLQITYEAISACQE